MWLRKRDGEKILPYLTVFFDKLRGAA